MNIIVQIDIYECYHPARIRGPPATFASSSFLLSWVSVVGSGTSYSTSSALLIPWRIQIAAFIIFVILVSELWHIAAQNASTTT